MIRWHDSPKVGVAKCTAKANPGPGERGCNYAHYSSKAGAQEAFEERMSKEEVSTVIATIESDNYFDNPDNMVSYYFPVSRLEKAQTLIDNANRRLERQGIEERFAYSEEFYSHAEEENQGISRSIPMCKFTINAPSISIGGYSFLSTMTRAGSEGFVTRVSPGVELNGWRPDEMVCDHCGTNRRRRKTYLIEDPDGKRVQVGSTCVEAYLGIKPKGLWALEFDPSNDLEEEKERSYGFNDYEYPVDATIALSLAITEEEGFVSKSRAFETGETPTSEIVAEFLIDSPHNKDEEAYRERIYARTNEILENNEVEKVLKMIDGMSDDSDYAVNLKSVSHVDNVNSRDVPLLVSSVILKAREEKFKQPSWSPGFIAEKGVRVKGTKLTVVTNKVSTQRDYSGWGTVTKSRIVFRDENNKQAIWWASKKIDVKEGEKVTLKGGSVKDHKNYNGVDQTVLTRVNFDLEGSDN